MRIAEFDEHSFDEHSIARRLTVQEAAEVLGLGERIVRPWGTRYDEEGLEGLDRRMRHASTRGAPVDEVMETLELH